MLKLNKGEIMKKKKLIITIISLLIIILTLTIIIFINKEPSETKPKEIQKIDEIEEYNYYLEEDSTTYYKELYNELKEIISETNVDYTKYAEKISQLFTTDLFTLDNKITSNDIGGLQFVYTDFKEDFIKIAKTTLYSSVESNIYNDRVQELPTVTNTKIVSLKESSFTYQDTNYDSYEVIINIEYQKDLGYPQTYNLTLIKNGKYLQVAKAYN